MFHPGPLGVFINPFWLARRNLDRHVRTFAGRLDGRILDIGCGTKPYRHYFKSTDYVGLEIAGRDHDPAVLADAVYDGDVLPFDDARFDGVVLFQVLEHVFEPERLLSEIARVLRPGGRLLITVPFVWDEHEQPYDYGRYSSFGLRHLCGKHGFTEIAAAKSCPAPQALFQLANGYIFKLTVTRSPIVNLICTAAIMAPVTALGVLVGLLFPSQNDLYLDNIALYERTNVCAPNVGDVGAR
jgi:SAM-dependent methyltransferase